MIDLEKYVSGKVGNVKSLTRNFLTYPEVIEAVYGDVVPGTMVGKILFTDFCERYNIYYTPRVAGSTGLIHHMDKAEEYDYEYFLFGEM